MFTVFEHNEIATIAWLLGGGIPNRNCNKARKRLRELLNEVRHYAAHRIAGNCGLQRLVVWTSEQIGP